MGSGGLSDLTGKRLQRPVEGGGSQGGKFTGWFTEIHELAA